MFLNDQYMNRHSSGSRMSKRRPGSKESQTIADLPEVKSNRNKSNAHLGGARLINNYQSKPVTFDNLSMNNKLEPQQIEDRINQSVLRMREKNN